jgi:hypothetical protein
MAYVDVGGGVEDVEHFWLRCPRSAVVRRECISRMSSVDPSLQWLLSGGDREADGEAIVQMAERPQGCLLIS